jgi:hypothetical protein
MRHNFRPWELNSKKYIIFACSSNFCTLSLTWSLRFQRLLHVSGNSHQISYLPFFIPFNWCDIVLTFKLINDWKFDSACIVGIQSLCEPLFPWSKNLHIFAWNLLCITCMLIWTIQQSYTMPFHRCLFLESWYTFVTSCLFSHATFLEYPCHTFYVLQKTKPKTLLLATSSSHQESVDNIFVCNIMKKSHSKHTFGIIVYQSLALID